MFSTYIQVKNVSSFRFGLQKHMAKKILHVGKFYYSVNSDHFISFSLISKIWHKTTSFICVILMTTRNPKTGIEFYRNGNNQKPWPLTTHLAKERKTKSQSGSQQLSQINTLKFTDHDSLVAYYAPLLHPL